MDPKKAEKRLNIGGIKLHKIDIEKDVIAHPSLSIVRGIRELPLARARVCMEIEGLSDTGINAIRRTMLDEIEGAALQTALDEFVIDAQYDDFAQQHFIMMQIAFIPLRLNLDKNIISSIYYSLHKINSSAVPMKIYASDLELHFMPGVRPFAIKEAIFNPTFVIAEISPGKALQIKHINIVTGYGNVNASFQPICRAAMENVDIEQYSPQEMNMKSEVSEMSGYKVSCMLADSCHHRIRFVVKAYSHESEILSFIRNTFINLVSRFRAVINVVSGANIIDYTDGMKQLTIELDDTVTVAHTIVKAMFDYTKNTIYHVSYVNNDTINKRVLKIIHIDPISVLTSTLQYIVAVYEKLLSQV